MPSNKNAFTRYKILDEMLSNRYHNYTIDDLVDGVNERLADVGVPPVGKRCIEKDLDYLKGMYSPFMADIVAEPLDVFNGDKTVRRKCYRYSDPSFSIFKKELSNEEKYLLSQAISILGQFDGLPHLEELERLRTGLGDRSMRQVVSFSKNPLEGSNRFGELFSAITQKQVVKLVYHLFTGSGMQKEVYFHPYLLKEYNRRWYVLGLTEEDKRPLGFVFDRLDDWIPQPSRKYLPYDGQFDEWFDDIIGVTKFRDKPVQRILFWVSDDSKKYVETKPLHESQIKYSGKSEADYRQQYPDLASGAFFSIDCRENYELIRELMSYGENLVVLAPESIKSQIIEKIAAMAQKYSPTRT